MNRSRSENIRLGLGTKHIAKTLETAQEGHKTLEAGEAVQEEAGDAGEKEASGCLKHRPPCPFFGFVGIFGKFADTRTNACGLAADADVCIMHSPSWNACERRNSVESDGRLNRLLVSGTIFPDELRPEHRRGRTWGGIRLQDWLMRVVRNHEPPQTA